MEERVLNTLEFHKVLKQLSSHASSSLGKEKIPNLRPASNIDQARTWQKETREATIVLRLKGSVPLGGIRNIRGSVQRAAIGGTLSPSELLDIFTTLGAAGKLRSFFKLLLEEEELPLLQGFIEQLDSLPQVRESISRCVDENGEIKDTASPALLQLRRQIHTLEGRVREKLEQYTRSSAYQKMLQEQIVTVRNDRYVLPVKAEYRHTLGGIVHDQSASGATLFIEPEAVVQLNNQLRESKGKEEREIERILRMLSEEISSFADPLKTNIEALAELDFIFARAYYAQHIKATEPTLNAEGRIRFKKARHPLIPFDEVVAIDVELGKDYSAIVITGPNTGGKTVSLKTIGLLSLMAAAGLHIPVDEGSEAAVFSSVFADIGDEQSIEQNLSTFSAHMTNIIYILQQMDERSLVLFDELGAGTDPAEGAALAIAILDEVISRGARVVATTHYSELKAYAYNRRGVINASVEFDVETLRPTYRLLIGVPGRSNAFAIASRLGLDESIIARAKDQISQEESRVESMIASLEQSRKKAEEEEAQAAGLRREVEQLRNELEREREKFDRERDRLLQQARDQAEQAVAEAKKEADRIITELREMAKQEHVSIKEHKLIEARRDLEDAIPEYNRDTDGGQDVSAQEPIHPGDEVKVLSLGQKGHVIEELGNGEWLVQIGIIKTSVKRGDLKRLNPSQKSEAVQVSRIRSSRQDVKMELDIRGQKVEEALPSLDKYLDDALLAGLHQVSVIHGKGTGQLRKGVHEFLRRHRHVKSFRLGGQGEGGLGATIVELR